MNDTLNKVTGRVDVLQRAFYLLELFFKCGDNQRVCKLTTVNGKAILFVQSYFVLEFVIGDTDEDIDVTFVYEAIAPMLAGDTYTIEIYPEAVAIETSSGSCRLPLSFAELFRLDIGSPEMRRMVDTKRFISNLTTLDKLTEFKNQYKRDATILVHKNITMSAYRTAYFYTNSANNQIEQVFDMGIARLLRELISAETLVGETAEYIVFKDLDCTLTMSRSTQRYLDPASFEEKAKFLAEFQNNDWLPAVTSLYRIQKNSMVTVGFTGTTASIGFSSSATEILRKCQCLVVENPTTFTLPLNFFYSALNVFKGKVGVYLCQLETTRALILRGESLKCVISLTV